MTSWSSRIAAVVSARDANANSANSADRSALDSIGTTGTIGKGVSDAEAEPSGELLALSARPEAVGPPAVVAVPPCPATVTERAALIEHGDDCDRVEADRRALAEFGLASWAELADAHAAAIGGVLDRLPDPTSSDGRRLLELTRKFLGAGHWRRAIECGWPLLELFGVHAHAPVVRVEGWGLVTTLAWTRLVGPQLERITSEAAIIRYRSGSRLSHRVGGPGMCACVLWWECHHVVGEHGP